MSRAGPFREILEHIGNLSTFSNAMLGLNYDAAIKNNARVLAEGRIRESLIREAEHAISTIEEYNYGPLKERFLTNISDPRHVFISSDLSYVQVLDVGIIGDDRDFVSGLYVSDADPLDRSFVWKYGIYKPSREGGTRSSRQEKLPTYEEVIEERLTAWGDKAPYWMLINDGNYGSVMATKGGMPYPTFQGYNFVQRVRSEAKQIIQDTIDAVSREIALGVEAGIIVQLEQPQKPVRVEFGRIELGMTEQGKCIQAAVKQYKTGETYYQLVIGGRYAQTISAAELGEYRK